MLKTKTWAGRSISLLAMCTVALMGAGCDNETDQSAADLTFPVSVEKARHAPIAEYISTTGTLRPLMEERVVAEVQGTLRLARNNGLDLAAGRRVQKGYLLAVVENPEYLLNVRVESQKLAMDNAARELEKQNALFKEGGVTEKELEISRRAALDARLNYEAAVLQADKLKLRAPISGYMTNVRRDADGTRVAAGFVLTTVMDYARVLADVNLPNSDLGRVQPGQSVIISNYALPGANFTGAVTAIDPTLDTRTRTFKVTVDVDNPKGQLRPGMFVKTDIVVASRDSALVIPKTAILTRNNRPVVFVVDKAAAEEREITTGIETREEVEILDGVTLGEQVVIRGQETLRDKSKVRVTR